MSNQCVCSGLFTDNNSKKIFTNENIIPPRLRLPVLSSIWKPEMLLNEKAEKNTNSGGSEICW